MADEQVTPKSAVSTAPADTSQKSVAAPPAAPVQKTRKARMATYLESGQCWMPAYGIFESGVPKEIPTGVELSSSFSVEDTKIEVKED